MKLFFCSLVPLFFLCGELAYANPQHKTHSPIVTVRRQGGWGRTWGATIFTDGIVKSWEERYKRPPDGSYTTLRKYYKSAILPIQVTELIDALKKAKFGQLRNSYSASCVIASSDSKEVKFVVKDVSTLTMQANVSGRTHEVRVYGPRVILQSVNNASDPAYPYVPAVKRFVRLYALALSLIRPSEYEIAQQYLDMLQPAKVKVNHKGYCLPSP